MKLAIRERVVHHEPGLYFYIVFPIATAFLLTFAVARIVSHLWPEVYIPFYGIHVHHFTYGFFILAISGYLALVFSGPRAKYLIALLHGLGLGLAFDEFGFWLYLNDSNPARFSYDGFIIILGSLTVLLTAKRGLKMIKNHLPWPK